MSTRPCEGGCGRTITCFGGRLYCIGCQERRNSARRAERKREVHEALARGEAPPPRKVAPEETKRCAACNVEFTTHVARRRYCSKQCGEKHRYRTGERVNAPRERKQRSVGVGSAQPLIPTDWEGMLRRAVSNAEAGLSSAAMRECGVPEFIIRKAMKAAGVDKRRRNGDYALLPFGPPV
jgi:hypothetical protein